MPSTTLPPIPPPATTASPGAPVTAAPGGAGHHLSVAFVSEVRAQWAIARTAYDAAIHAGDEGAQQDAAERLDELLELLRRHDLSLDVLRVPAPH